ncbi:MAG: hypothetical protein OEY03_07690 [Rhizobacter sp.]|nr:hypothetical protein [Rhizobacter sp.]
MTERSLKALTWATLVAALASAALLAALGCVLPESLQSSSNRLLSIVMAVSECDAPLHRKAPLEALQRAWNRNLVLPKH